MLLDIGAHLGSASIEVREEAHSDLQKGPLCRFRRACRRYGTGRNRHPKVRTEASCNRVGDPGESCTWAPKASKRAYVYHWVSTSILTSKSPGWPLWSGLCPPPWDYCGQACVPPLGTTGVTTPSLPWVATVVRPVSPPLGLGTTWRPSNSTITEKL